MASPSIQDILSRDAKSADVLRPLLLMLEKIQGLELREASDAFWKASRDEDWRIPIGESGVLDFFHHLLASRPEDPYLTLNALRILGNSSADKDANRQRLIDSSLTLKPILEQISDADTRMISTVVLYNICNNYEPAQDSAISDGACGLLFDLIDPAKTPDFDEDLDYFLRLLELLVARDSGKTAAPPSAIKTLLHHLIHSEPSFDDTLSLLTLLSTLLSHPPFHKIAISQKLVPEILDVLEATLTLSPGPDSEKRDTNLVSYARTSLTESFGDLCTAEGFLQIYPLGCPLLSHVQEWLVQEETIENQGKADLTVAACLVFGNIARSDLVCIELVEKMQLHHTLQNIILATIRSVNKSVSEAKRKTSKRPQEAETDEKMEAGNKSAPSGAMSIGILHVAAGVLKNLAIPITNKPSLGTSGVLGVIREMLHMEGIGVGQVYYSAVSLGRLVIRDCEQNARLLLSSKPEKNNEGAEVRDSLLSLFLKIHSTAEEAPTKTEIERTIAAVLRLCNSSDTNVELLEQLLAHGKSVSRALWEMVLQEQWAVVASEGWFALALLSRSGRGAQLILEEWGQKEQEVVEKILGNDTKGKDWDNLGVMLSGVRAAAGERVEAVEELLGRFIEGKKQSTEGKHEEKSPVLRVGGHVEGHLEGKVEGHIDTHVQGEVEKLLENEIKEDVDVQVERK